MSLHPIQPLVIDAHGVQRFKGNAIVRHILDWATANGHGLNELTMLDFTNEDWRQFAQLIGYSLDGFGELPYCDDATYDAARRMADTGQTEDQARIASLTEELEALRTALREPMARLFGIHPDDLQERS